MSDPLRDPRDLIREALDRTPECPSLDALAAAVPAAAVQQHLESCAHCRAELAMFQQFESGEVRPEEAADLAWVNSELTRRQTAAKPDLADRFRAWFTLPRLSLAAAALMVLIAVGLYLPTRNGVPFPQNQGNPVWRSGQLAAISPIGDLDHAPTQLRWEGVTGAASYHVRLLEVDGTEIWKSDVSTTTVEIPNGIAGKMAAGRAFQWDVVARDSAGQQVASTNLRSFHITVTSR